MSVSYQSSHKSLSYKPDLIGTLRGFLQGLQGFSSVVHELLQNAEDAGASAFYLRFTPEALWVGNDGEFSDENFEKLASPAAGSKRHDVEKIGSFGIGFTSVYQLTDAPEIMSRGKQLLLRPLEQEAPFLEGVQHEWPTTIRLPWAFEQTELRDGLDADVVRKEQFSSFIHDGLQALRDSAIFLESVQLLKLMDGDETVEEIRIESAAGQRTLHSLEGKQTFRMYSREVTEPAVQYLISGMERKSEVTVAVPIASPDDFQGRFYAYLPTQDLTLLPFHVNADFYPQADRKSLIWDGNESTKQRWNTAILEAVKDLLPSILHDLRTLGPTALYPFAQACLEAAAQAPASKAGQWLTSCSAQVRQAFWEDRLLLDETGEWVSAPTFHLSVQGVYLAPHLRRRLHSRKQWSFPQEADQQRYAKFFRRLGLTTLDATRFLEQLPVLFLPQGDIEPHLDALGTARPAMQYLRQAIQQSPIAIDLDLYESMLRTTRFVASQSGHLASLEELWQVSPEWNDLVLNWWSESELICPDWIAEVPAELRALANTLSPENLLDNFRTWETDRVIAPLSGVVTRQQLYSFLNTGRLTAEDVEELPLFPGGDGELYAVDRLVLPEGIPDPFHLTVTAQTEPPPLEELLSQLGVRQLTARHYYTELLPVLAQTEPVQRTGILRHLAGTNLLEDDFLDCWRELPIVQTRSGGWVKPHNTSFEHPLLEDLLGSVYDPVTELLAEDKKLRRLLVRLGVDEVPKNQRLAEIANARSSEPVTEEALTFRSKLLRYALEQPELLELLQSVQWLPDLHKKRWCTPGSLWPQQRAVLVGNQNETNRAFLGLEVNDDEAAQLKLAEPKVATVIQNLKLLERKYLPLPQEALHWLNDRELNPKEVDHLRHLPFFQTGPHTFRPASLFFREPHELHPYRAQLHQDYLDQYPELINQLKIKARPTAEDYAAVLTEVSNQLPESGLITDDELRELAVLCLHACANEWSALDKEQRRKAWRWTEPLKRKRVIPLTIESRTYLYRPSDCFFNNLNQREISRYQLEEVLPYCAPNTVKRRFLSELGVRDMRRGIKVDVKSLASSGEPAVGQNFLLDRLRPSLIRLLTAKREQEPEVIEQELVQWRFVLLPQVRANISIPGFSVFRPKPIVLETHVERATHSILLSYEHNKYAPAIGLQEALGLEDSSLTTMFVDPDNAEELLDSEGIPPLPLTFIPSRLHSEQAFKPALKEIQQPAKRHSSQPSTLPNTSEPALSREDSRPLTPTESPNNSEVSPEILKTSLSGNLETPAPEPRGAVDDTPNDSSPRPTASDWSNRMRTSAQRAACGKDRLPEGSPTPKITSQRSGVSRVSRRQSTGSGRLRFRNFVHVQTSNGQGDDPSKHNLKVDTIGMHIVKQFELLQGRVPRDDSADKEGGYDIYSEGGGEVRYIEVKTLSGPWDRSAVTLSRKQMYTAFRKEQKYWLYVVEQAFDRPRLWCLSNPAWVATSYTFDDAWADSKLTEGPFE